MSKLFEEAIADAKKLREIAEENAKKKIIDSMAPRIRQLIEQELVPDMDIGQEDDVSLEDIMLDPKPEDASPDAEPTVVVNVDGTANIGISSEEVEVADDEDEDDLMVLNQESAMALASLISPKIRNKTIIEKINNLQSRFQKLDRYLSAINKNGKNVVLRESACKHYTQLLKEVISLRDNLIFTEVADANNLNVRTKLERLNKEIKQMSKRHAETLFRRLFEGKHSLEEFDVTFTDDELDALAGAEGPDDVEDELGAIFDDIEVVTDAAGDEPDEDEDDDDEGVEVAAESIYRHLANILREQDEADDDAGDDMDVDAASAALSDLGDALGLDISVEEEGGDDDDDDDEAEDMDEMSTRMEADMDEMMKEKDMDEVYEVNEAALRRELRRLRQRRQLREQDEAVDADPFLAHDGEEVGDIMLDVDEDDLINALADELGSVDEPTVASTTVEESRIRRIKRAVRARRMNESRRATNQRGSRTNRASNNTLLEYKKAVTHLRKQLVEMNLFNAKLLYVNKLMQNRNLTSKQQRAIVEALDNAKTLREAKLLYKSLTASLNKKKSLTEGSVQRTLGSSSRSIRSAKPVNSGNEVDRWAVLAGIGRDN